MLPVIITGPSIIKSHHMQPKFSIISPLNQALHSCCFSTNSPLILTIKKYPQKFNYKATEFQIHVHFSIIKKMATQAFDSHHVAATLFSENKIKLKFPQPNTIPSSCYHFPILPPKFDILKKIQFMVDSPIQPYMFPYSTSKYSWLPFSNSLPIYQNSKLQSPKKIPKLLPLIHQNSQLQSSNSLIAHRNSQLHFSNSPQQNSWLHLWLCLQLSKSHCVLMLSPSTALHEPSLTNLIHLTSIKSFLNDGHFLKGFDDIHYHSTAMYHQSASREKSVLFHPKVMHYPHLKKNLPLFSSKK